MLSTSDSLASISDYVASGDSDGLFMGGSTNRESGKTPTSSKPSSVPLQIGGQETQTRDQEQIWSLAEYIEAEEIKAAFNLEKSLPPKLGAIINQPLPKRDDLVTIASISTVSAIALIFCGIFFSSMNSSKTLLVDNFTLPAMVQEITPPEQVELEMPGTIGPITTTIKKTKYISPSFEIDNNSGLIEFKVMASIDNSWVEMDVDLINEQTGETKHLEVGVEYYHGYDYDGYWSEGGKYDSWTFSALPKGKYHISIEVNTKDSKPVRMDVQLVEGVSSFGNFMFALFLIFLPGAGVYAYMALFDWWKKST
jgi:hypothetical protein